MTDEQRKKLIDELENDTFDPSDWEGLSDEPVSFGVEMAPSKVVAIDNIARAFGKTRSDIINECVDRMLATA